jgi:hypothetical protein
MPSGHSDKKPEKVAHRVTYRTTPDDIEARLRELAAEVRELRRQLQGGKVPAKHALAKVNDARLPKKARRR